jgi:replicative DNA helicase
MTVEEQVITSTPHSRTAEDGLLGALLIDSERIREITLEPEDFYIIRNQWIYGTMRDLAQQHRDVDYITVCAALDEKKRLAEIGGPAYIMSLISLGATNMHPESYAAIIRERSERRKILAVAQALTTAAYDLTAPTDSARSAAMDRLARSVVTDKGAVHISRFISELYDEVEEAAKNPRSLYGITTGLPDWDRTTYGLQKGTKILLSGEPGVGKSVLAAQVLVSAAKAGHPGALYELEMTGRQVVRRLVAGESNIPTMKMRQGTMTEEEIPLFTHAIEAMAGLPIYISQASALTTAELRADLMKLKDNFGVELVVVDYEGLLGDLPDKDYVQRTSTISQRVHDIAKDLDVALLSLSSMTKEGIKGTQKGQAAVAGAADNLHDADEIIVIRKGTAENTVTLTWEKNREGSGDNFVSLVKKPGFPVFVSSAPARRMP